MKLKFQVISRLLFFFALLPLICCSKNNEETIIQTPVAGDPAQYETPFQGVPNTSDIAMYEINERAFTTSGNLAAIIPRLDAIKSLGVNVIWLMPIYQIGVLNSINSPYCVKNYTEVNSEFGNLEDLRTLVREAHSRGMSVILDWVANHTSWDNPWIQNKSWYSQDSNGAIIHPAGTTWTDVADLNFDNAQMRLEMIKDLKYWVLTANVDGFRCDAADMVPFAFWKQAIDALKAIPNRKLIMLAEGSRSDHFQAGFQLNFGWDFYTKNKGVFGSNQSAVDFYTTHLSEYASIPTSSNKLRFTSNHDECAWDNTPLVLFGGKKASITAFVISTFMGGVPLIYNGQEVGCSVKLPFFSKSPIDWTTNPDMLIAYQGIMGIRTNHLALRTGDLVNYSDADLTVFKRKKDTDEVLVLANTRNATKSFSIPTILQNTVWKDALSGTPITLEATLSLTSFEYRVLVKQ